MALSQEQINAILEGTGTYEEADDAGLTEEELNFFQTFSETAMEAGSVAISQALGQTVSVSHPELIATDATALKQELSNSQVMIRTGYLTDREYESLLLIKDYDVAVIFDILMGKDGRNPDLEISDLQISAIGEVMNQLVGAAATELSKKFERKVAMIPPDSQMLDLKQSSLPGNYQQEDLLQVRYHLVIEGVLDSEFFEVRTQEAALKLFQTLTQKAGAMAGAPPTAPAMGAPAPATSTAGMNAPAPAPSAPAPPVRPVEFAALAPRGLQTTGNPNLDRILDIPLRVTVELGASRLKVKNILDLNKGSIVELDKLAGEPVDMLVNGRLMAKGEVVVINENFGVRITEILGPADRLQNLADS